MQNLYVIDHVIGRQDSTETSLGTQTWELVCLVVVKIPLANIYKYLVLIECHTSTNYYHYYYYNCPVLKGGTLQKIRRTYWELAYVNKNLLRKKVNNRKHRSRVYVSSFMLIDVRNGIHSLLPTKSLAVFDKMETNIQNENT